MRLGLWTTWGSAVGRSCRAQVLARGCGLGGWVSRAELSPMGGLLLSGLGCMDRARVLRRSKCFFRFAVMGQEVVGCLVGVPNLEGWGVLG